MARIETTTCDQLDVRDPIFASLHVDYPDFPQWFSRASGEYRTALVVTTGSGNLAAVAVLKDERDPSSGLHGPATQVCTLKVAEHARGHGLGTALLEHIVDTARMRGHTTVHLTTLEGHTSMRHLAARTGLREISRPTPGHVTYARALTGDVGQVALMSIHPQYVHAILAGHKRVELRKRRLAPDVTHVVMYATAPVGRVLGTFEVLGQDTGVPADIWTRHHEHAAIVPDAYDSYFTSSPTAVAILAGAVHRCDPLPLASLTGARPPQSFAYLTPDQVQVATRAELLPVT